MTMRAISYLLKWLIIFAEATLRKNLQYLALRHTLTAEEQIVPVLVKQDRLGGCKETLWNNDNNHYLLVI